MTISMASMTPSSCWYVSIPPLRRSVHNAPPTLWWNWFSPQPPASIIRSSTHFMPPAMPPWYTGAGQQDAVGFDAGGNDVVDHVVGLHAAQRAGIQAVIAGHAGVDPGTGLEHLELHAGGRHLFAHGLQKPGGISVFPGASVDGYNLHGSLLL